MARMAMLIVMLAVALLAKAGEPEGGSVARPDSLPPYVRILTPSESPKRPTLDDDTFNRSAGYTIFRVNSTRMNMSDPFLRELAEGVLPYARQAGLELVDIEIRGAASPEGPYLNNVRLSKGRAAQLVNFLSAHLSDYQMREADVHTIAEDYAFLLWTLEQRGDADAPVVRRIIKECGADNHAAIKAALQHEAGGTLWRRLLRDIYPGLRAARVVLYFRLPGLPFPDAAMADTIRRMAPLDITSDDLLEVTLPAATSRVRRHALAVSTNLLYDAFYMPNYGMAPMANVGVEFFPRRGHFTVLGQFTFPYYHRWSRQQFFQIRDYHLEARYYLHPGAWHTGWFAAAYVNANKYGIGLSRTKGWQGEGGGGALKGGYVWPLGRQGRWRLEASAAVGLYVTRFDPYVYGNPLTGTTDGDYYYDYTGPAADFTRRNYRRIWAGPTEVSLSLSCDILYWRGHTGADGRHRKGVSLKRKEAMR